MTRTGEQVGQDGYTHPSYPEKQRDPGGKSQNTGEVLMGTGGLTLEEVQAEVYALRVKAGAARAVGT